MVIELDGRIYEEEFERFGVKDYIVIAKRREAEERGKMKHYDNIDKAKETAREYRKQGYDWVYVIKTGEALIHNAKWVMSVNERFDDLLSRLKNVELTDENYRELKTKLIRMG